MPKITQTIAIISLCLLVPLVPFLFFHEAIENRVQSFVENPPSYEVVFAVVVGLLSTDIFLPIPSSMVSTLAGTILPVEIALVASWIGLNLSAIVGFVTGRFFGRSAAIRFSNSESLQQMETLTNRYGIVILVLTRALPILAEAAVLFVATNKMPWRRFMLPIVLSNLGIAIAYSLFGSIAKEQEWIVVALAISVAFPLLLTGIVRFQFRNTNS